MRCWESRFFGSSFTAGLDLLLFGDSVGFNRIEYSGSDGCALYDHC